MPAVALVAPGAGGNTAVASRIGAFQRGLTRRGWRVIVVAAEVRTVGSPIEQLLDHMPEAMRSALASVGVEGDVQPAIGLRARHALRGVGADVAVVSVPPFSLLATAALALDRCVPLIVDYRDPWSARASPTVLARATRAIERRAVQRARAVVYAGGAALGDHLVRHLRLPSHCVLSVPNGVDPNDIEGLRLVQPRTERNGRALQLVMAGYWYGRNGPGILVDALERVGPAVARLAVVGGVSAPLASALKHTTGQPSSQHGAVPRHQLYQRLQHADAAVLTVDRSSALESRIPAKVYDYLATGVPVIAVCPRDAALLQTPGADRFHRVDQDDVAGLVALLRLACRDRSFLRAGQLGQAPTRDVGVEILHKALLGTLGFTTE